MIIKSERLIKIKRGRNPQNAMVGFYEVEISGVPGEKILQGIFGSFDIQDGEAFYSAMVYTDETGKIFHDYRSEFADDLKFL